MSRQSNALKILLVGAALTLPSVAFAANTHVQSFAAGHNGNTNVLSIATTGSAVGAGDHVMGFASCWVPTTAPSVSTITDDKSNNYIIADTGTAVEGSGHNRWVSYYLLNINNAPSTVTVTWTANCKYNNNVADEFSGSLGTTVDVHTGQVQSGLPNTTDAATSGNVTPTATGELAYGAGVIDSALSMTNPGTGWTAGISDAVAGDNRAYTEYRLSQGTTSLAATFTPAAESGSQYDTVAIMTFAPPVLPTPIGASCLQNGSPNPTLPDNSANNTVVCGYTVTMSDNSTFTGNVTVSQQGGGNLFGLSAATGNANLQLARAAAVSDDGIQTALLNAVQNGVNWPFTVNLQVTPTAVAGTPISFGFKGINPGTSDTPQSGSVIFTAPRPMAVMGIVGRVSEPLGSSGLLDVYKAGSGVPCAGGVKLHTGDFNANGAIDVNQPFSLSLINDTSVTGNTHTSTTIDTLSANVTLRGWEVGDTITGSGIPANDTIASIAANGLSLTLANATTTTVTTDALTVATLPLAQGDNVCVTTTGSGWSAPAAVDATITVTVQ